MTITADRPPEYEFGATPAPAHPAHRSHHAMALTANDIPAAADGPHRGLRDRMEDLVDQDGPSIYRVGGAKTSIRFRVGDDEKASFVLLADRRPPAVVDVGEPAEIELRLSFEHAARFACGDLVIPIEIMGGSLEYDGPVRKYLDIDPILRAMLDPEGPR